MKTNKKEMMPNISVRQNYVYEAISKNKDKFQFLLENYRTPYVTHSLSFKTKYLIDLIRVFDDLRYLFTREMMPEKIPIRPEETFSFFLKRTCREIKHVKVVDTNPVLQLDNLITNSPSFFERTYQTLEALSNLIYYLVDNKRTKYCRYRKSTIEIRLFSVFYNLEGYETEDEKLKVVDMIEERFNEYLWMDVSSVYSLERMSNLHFKYTRNKDSSKRKIKGVTIDIDLILSSYVKKTFAKDDALELINKIAEEIGTKFKITQGGKK